MSSTSNKTKWLYYIGGAIILIVIIPFLLNTTLKCRTIEVIGDEKLWLTFWGAYIGAIASFVVAFLTYRTLCHYKDSQKDTDIREEYKGKIAWLGELRHSMAEYLSYCNLPIISELSEMINYKNYDAVIRSCNDQITYFKKAEFELGCILLNCERTSEYGQILDNYQKTTYDIVIALRSIATNARYVLEDNSSFLASIKRTIANTSHNTEFDLLRETYAYLLDHEISIDAGTMGIFAIKLGSQNNEKAFNDVIDIYSYEAEQVNDIIKTK